MLMDVHADRDTLISSPIMLMPISLLVAADEVLC
jgi:hypothetical protein